MAGRIGTQVSGVLEFLSAAELSSCLPLVTVIVVSAYLDTNVAVGASFFVHTVPTLHNVSGARGRNACNGEYLCGYHRCPRTFLSIYRLRVA